MSLGVRHVSRRRRAGIKHAFDLLIYPVAVAAPLALLPQVIQVYKTQDTGSLALPTWLVLGTLNLVWLIYGFVHRDKPIMLTNIMLACMNFAVVFGIYLYN